jgi:Arm DNA-binding domain
MKLTTKAIARLALPADKADAIFFDDDMPGFGFRLRRSGSQVRRSFVAQYRARGRTRRMLIGSVELLSAEQARAQAKKILASVAIGRDPQGEKAAARSKLARTLRSVADDYLAAKQSSLRPASFRVTKLYLTGRPYFGPLHTAGIGEITRADVASRLSAITRNSGTVTGSRARSALSTMFAWAMGEGLCDNNPVIGTNKPADSTPRDRVLDDSELAAIWAAAGHDEYGKVLKLLMLTAAARRNCRNVLVGDRLGQGAMGAAQGAGQEQARSRAAAVADGAGYHRIRAGARRPRPVVRRPRRERLHAMASAKARAGRAPGRQGGGLAPA